MTDVLTDLARTDRRVARELAAAEREQIAARQRIDADDKAADRKLRVREAELLLADKQAEINDRRADRRRKEREAARADRKARRTARRTEQAATITRWTTYARENAAAVYSGLIYGLAVTGALYGQIDAASRQDLPTAIAIIGAVAIEGTGLAMALTAQEQRLQGERATAARALIWLATATAVGINWWGHQDAPITALVLSVLSAIGITVYEIRSALKHRKALRKLGMIPAPPERYGWRRWVVALPTTWRAWRLDARDRLSPGAANLVRRAENARHAATQRKLTKEIAERARSAAAKAARKGEAGPALAALMQLAHTGTPAPQLAIAGPDRAAVETARRSEAAARNAQAAAEAEARTARAEAAAAITDARAEAAAAIADARAEAAAAATAARAEAAGAISKARAEVAAAVRASQAEADRLTELLRAADANLRDAREETARLATWHGQSKQAVETSHTRAQQLAADLDATERRLQEATVKAASAERVLTAERQRRAELEATTARTAQQLAAEQATRGAIERQAATLADEKASATALVDQLRADLAAAAAGARRTRATAKTTPAEPVLLDGVPVPTVKGVSAENVAKVLKAQRDAAPGTTQKALAEQVGVSTRVIQLVAAATRTESTELPGQTAIDSELVEAGK